jgi:hypothetical protein
VPGRHASDVSEAGSSAACTATPRKARQLRQLLLCGGIGHDEPAVDGTPAGLLLLSGHNSPAAVHRTASTGALHQSHILSNPGTPKAAAAARARRQRSSSSSSSSPLKTLRDWLLARGFSQEGFGIHQAGFSFRSSSSSSSSSSSIQFSPRGSAPGSRTKAAGPLGLSNKSSRSSSRLCSTSAAGDRPVSGTCADAGHGTDNRDVCLAGGMRSSSLGQQQALLGAAASGWCVVHSTQRTASGVPPGHTKGTTADSSARMVYHSQHSNSGKAGDGGTCAACGDADPAASGAAVLAVDWQQGTFTFAAPATAGRLHWR